MDTALISALIPALVAAGLLVTLLVPRLRPPRLAAEIAALRERSGPRAALEVVASTLGVAVVVAGGQWLFGPGGVDGAAVAWAMVVTLLASALLLLGSAAGQR